MKFTVALLAVALILLGSSCQNKRAAISISGAFALYPITVKWAEEYKKLHPDIQIDISAGGAGKGMADALSGMVDLGMFSREVSSEEAGQGAWFIALTRDAVLPTLHSDNPFIGELKKRGVTREILRKLYVTGEITSWEELLGKVRVQEVALFTRSDACGAAAMWAAYLGVNQEDLLGLGVFGDPGVANAVKDNILGLGYNNVAYVFDMSTRLKYDHLEVLPLDLDGNGHISPGEDFYGNLDSVVEAIRDGRYPSPPARDLYFVSCGKPESEEVTAFIEWILTEGQQFLKEAGYVQLPPEQIADELKKLHL